MRIGVDIGKALGPDDGLATSSRLLVRTLLQVDRDNEYLLFDLHHPRLDRERLEAVFGGLPTNARVVAEPAADHRLDLFHAPAHRLPSRRLDRLVFTLHDLTFLSHPHLHTLSNRLDTLAAVSRAAAAGADFIAVSGWTRDEALARLGVAGERLTVVPWAPGPAFKPLDDPARGQRHAARFGVDRPYLLSVGSMEPRKNLVALVDAFVALPDGLRDRHALVLVGGEGWRNLAIRERLERARSTCRVLCLGAVRQATLVALYNGARALAYPSLAEGFGLPVVEAMACGCPVVTSSSSALPEAAGGAALLVDPGDPAALRQALERVLADEALRADLRARGLARAAALSWRRTAEQTLAVYRRAVATRP